MRNAEGWLIILTPPVQNELMRKVGLKISFWMIYIPFSVLVRALTHIGVSIIWGSFSYNFTVVTSTVGICPSRFLIGRFYKTFINRFCYFHAFKHVYSCFKSNRFTIKSHNIFMIAPATRHGVQQNCFPSHKFWHLPLPQGKHTNTC